MGCLAAVVNDQSVGYSIGNLEQFCGDRQGADDDAMPN